MATDQRRRLFYIGLSFGVGLTLMAIKFYAYRLTRSSAILSDALESIINVVASAFAIGSIIMAAIPPDESHPYGHGKIEFFSAGFEGALIIVAACGIFKTGIARLLAPQPLPYLDAGLMILLTTSIVNLILGLGLVRAGRQTDSITLVADGRHVLTDVYTSAGVVVGLGLVMWTGWLWLDGLVACLVGLNILITGFSLVRQAFHGLMDAADPSVLKSLSEMLIENRRPNWIDIHQLRAWKAGDHTHIDMHLVLPRDCCLEAAHAEAKKVEALVIGHFGGRASALIHLDACIEEDCPVCHSHMCGLRNESTDDKRQWRLDTVTAQKGDGRFRFSTRRKA
ncbi:MAG: cation diffusion facilitator family transporter [Desulfobacterales bacterium]